MQSTADILRIKIEVRERDGNRCTQCGLTNQDHKEAFDRQLEVHRLVQGSLYNVDGCVTLCWPCHLRTKKQRGILPEIREVRVSTATFNRLKEMAEFHGNFWTGPSQFLEDFIEAEHAGIQKLKRTAKVRRKEKEERGKARKAAEDEKNRLKEDEQLPPDRVGTATPRGCCPIPD